MLLWLGFIFTFANNFGEVFCIPLSNFYPFGIARLDTSLFRNDDSSSPAVDLSVTFPYFDQNYKVVYVNNNGAISFTKAISQYTPDGFPLNSTQDLVATFWADVDTRPLNGGAVWYRETSNSDLLERFQNDIRSAFPNQRLFIPKSLFIITWDRVGYYNQHTDKLNTFQCVMGTDERRSYVIFLYADGGIQWTTGDASNGTSGFGGVPAQVGFNAGDRIRFFNVPGSRTSEIISIANTSNVDRPGVWIFRMDEEIIITAGCTEDTSSGTLLLAPRLGNVLGGTPVKLSGPCFEEDDDIICQFNDVVVMGTRLNKDIALCVSPQLEVTGRVNLQLTVTRADGTVAFVGQETYHSVLFEQFSDTARFLTDTPMLKTGVEIAIEWSPEVFFPRPEDDYKSGLVNIELYILNKEMKWIPHRSSKLKSNVPNTGNTTVIIPNIVQNFDSALAVIRISLVEGSMYSRNIAEWTNMGYTESMTVVLKKACSGWCNRETAIGIRALLINRLPACPPTVRSAIIDALYMEEIQMNDYQKLFHPDAVRCFRQATITQQNEGSGQQCCYYSNGTLIFGPRGGGSADRFAPTGYYEIMKHHLEDLIPYIDCCLGLNKCDIYYELRPSDSGNDYEVTPPACVYGDPHIVTLDGHKYTFNGKGEFTLIETPDDRFTLQARMIEATDDDGDAVQATVFSAIVGKQNDSDAVQLELSRRGIDARINGIRVDFEDVKEQKFNNVTVFDVGNKTIEAIFSSGVLISAKEENGIISVLLVSLSNTYVGTTRGLMGIFNGNTSDDLIPKGSTEALSLNSSFETIHHSFGITWIINNSADSLFNYHLPGESWSTYYDPDFTPLFEVEFSDPILENEAMELCQGDEFCLYDIATTGSMDIGLSTLNGSVSFEEIVETARPVICNPSCVNGACIANDTCQCAMGYSGQICTEPEYIECDVNPCENNGTCRLLAGSYICNCSQEFSGLFCEQNVTFRFEKAEYFVIEDSGTVELCILQSGESIIDLTAIPAEPRESTAEEAVDYNPSRIIVQFNQTDDMRCFYINIIDDFNREVSETFEVVLLPSAGVILADPYVATVTIIDDDSNRTYDIVEETLYTVPLNIDQHLIDAQPELAMAALCYSVDGRPNRYFNLVSDKCVSVNAYNIPAQRANYFNVISKIGITAVDRDGNCQNIEVDQEDCSATVGAMSITNGMMYNVAGISVKQRRNGYRISVPNCEPSSVVMWVFCKTIPEADMLKFIVARGNSLMPTSHGLVGQFWNVPVDVSPYEGITPDNTPYYSVMVTPADEEPRVFIGNLYPRTWDLSKVPCLYAGSSQGGTLGEFGDANDPVIDGHYSQYMVANLFDTQFKYSKFETDRCL